MEEIARTLIIQIISWPIVALVICWMFRSSICTFLEKIAHLKAAGLEVTTHLAVAAQPEPLDTQEELAGEALSIPREATDVRLRAVRSYGDRIPGLQNKITRIAEDLTSLGLTNANPETIQLLVRHLAVTQILLNFEFTYRIIFGSQISALKILNVTGSRARSYVEDLYSAAKEKYSTFYGTYSFADWLRFLVERNLVEVDENQAQVSITDQGRDLLTWIVLASVDDNKLY
jgi:hypothetical protein